MDKIQVQNANLSEEKNIRTKHTATSHELRHWTLKTEITKKLQITQRTDEAKHATTNQKRP